MLISEFLKYLTQEKNYSKHTVVAYETDLRQLMTFIKSDFDIDNFQAIDRTMIRSWVVEMRKMDVTPKSIHRKISSVQSFYRYLLKTGRVKSNPVSGISLPKIKKRLPQFVKQSEIEELLDNSLDGFRAQSWEEKRDYLIILISYGCGVRLSELIELKKSDIGDQNIKVTGKGNKQRLIPISKKQSDYIKIYTEDSHQGMGFDSEYLILKNDGAKCYEKFVYRKVFGYLSDVTSLKKKSPHVLRHSFATHLLDQGVDINVIKDLLGHASLAATQVYTHNSIEKIKTVYKSAHPRA